MSKKNHSIEFINHSIEYSILLNLSKNLYLEKENINLFRRIHGIDRERKNIHIQ